jgi:hypothetical protein
VSFRLATCTTCRTTRLPLEGFSRKLIFEYFLSKTVRFIKYVTRITSVLYEDVYKAIITSVLYEDVYKAIITSVLYEDVYKAIITRP